MKERGLTAQGALYEIGTLFEDTAKQWRDHRSQLPGATRPGDAAIIGELLDGIDLCIAGMIEWSFRTERYFHKSGMEVKEKRVVML